RGGSRHKRMRGPSKTSTPSCPSRQLGVESDYFWVTFLADAFLAGAFLAGAFFAGAFLAGAFLADPAFLGRSMPTSLAARSPTARVCDATVPSASWVSSTAWST